MGESGCDGVVGVDTCSNSFSIAECWTVLYICTSVCSSRVNSEQIFRVCYNMVRR